MSWNLPEEFAASRQVPGDLRDDLARVAPRLGPLAGRIHYFATTTSTNDVAARLADLGAEEGTTVVADAQTAGRGRRGRAWFSPEGAGLYVSVVFRPRLDLAGAGGARPASPAARLLTLASGVAIAEGMQASTGLPIRIKWPNDLVIGRRKVAGILAEAPATGGDSPCVVLGFGINLQAAAYPSDLADRATSIEAETGRAPARALVLAETLAALAARYADLQAGRFDAILTAWRALAPSARSSLVEWDTPDGALRGRTEGVDETGALVVRAGQTVWRLVAGEVRWIRTAGDT